VYVVIGRRSGTAAETVVGVTSDAGTVAVPAIGRRTPVVVVVDSFATVRIFSVVGMFVVIGLRAVVTVVD